LITTLGVPLATLRRFTGNVPPGSSHLRCGFRRSVVKRGKESAVKWALKMEV